MVFGKEGGVFFVFNQFVYGVQVDQERLVICIFFDGIYCVVIFFSSEDIEIVLNSSEGWVFFYDVLEIIFV